MSCIHDLIGKSDGVHCIKCGLHMSADEYTAYLNGGGEDDKLREDVPESGQCAGNNENNNGRTGRKSRKATAGVA